MKRTCPNLNCPCHKGNSVNNIFPHGYYKTKAGKGTKYRCLSKEVVVWDALDWKIPESQTEQNSVINIAICPHKQLAALERKGGTVSIMRVSTNFGLIPLIEFKAHRRLLSGMAFSPNGHFFATTSMTSIGFIWDINNWRPVMSLRGHSLGIHDVAFSSDSRRVVTTSSGQDVIILWYTTTHQEVMTISAEGSMFYNINFLLDGHTLVSTTHFNDSPMLHVWRAPSWETINNSETERETYD